MYDGTKEHDEIEPPGQAPGDLPSGSRAGLPDKQLVDKNGDGIYTGMMMLEPGVYEYKFVVNGEWRLDDRNPNFKPNDVGSLNSVLVVEEK